jgi:hypothetical protein
MGVAARETAARTRAATHAPERDEGAHYLEKELMPSPRRAPRVGQ